MKPPFFIYSFVKKGSGNSVSNSFFLTLTSLSFMANASSSVGVDVALAFLSYF